MTSMNNLALMYCQCGQLKEAEALEEEVLKVYRQVLGKCNPDTLTSMEEEVLKVCRQMLGNGVLSV